MNNISLKSVDLLPGFWEKRYQTNAETSMRHVLDRFEETGRMDALRFCYDGKKPLHIFYDSDVAKWIESVAYLLVKDRPKYAEYERIVDELVESMKTHQAETGYLNSYFQQIEPQNIFTRRADHELYCAGHLTEAACAYYEATQKRDFLDIMLKYVDYIERAFVTEQTAKFYTCGHEEIELALLRLYKITNDKKHLELAKHFIFTRGTKNESLPTANEKYDQSNLPARELREAEGHAVRALYFYAALAEYAFSQNDRDLFTTCKTLFEDVTNKKMYITGGVGSSRIGEAFTVAYDLPNLTAYSESCAAIALMMFCKNMQQAEENARYADIIERVLYNGFLSSTSLDGKAFFYENPLEIDLREIGKHTSILPGDQPILPSTRRKEVFDCSCCPPNITRTIAAIAEYIYAEENATLYVNQYISSRFEGVEMVSGFPSDGNVRIRIGTAAYKKIKFRKPFWADECRIKINGKECVPPLQNGYYCVEICGETLIETDFGMSVKYIYANPAIKADAGKIAVMRGPVVYALEGIDNIENLDSLSIDPAKQASIADNELCDLPRIEAYGCKDVTTASLYSDAEPRKQACTLRLIPYYTFANRKETNMAVWIRKA